MLGPVVWAKTTVPLATQMIVLALTSAQRTTPGIRTICVVKISKRSVVSSALRGVIHGSHPRIPFADLVCRVTSGLELSRHASHIPGDRSKAAHGVRWVPSLRSDVEDVDVDWEPT